MICDIRSVKDTESTNSFLVNIVFQQGGITAVMIASYRGHIEVVKYLIHMKADIHLKDDVCIVSLCIFLHIDNLVIIIVWKYCFDQSCGDESSEYCAITIR